MYNLFLDDTRNPRDVYGYTFRHVYIENEWMIVQNFDEFVHAIEINGIPNIVSFDHDLGLEHYNHQHDEDPRKLPYDQYTEKTGYDCAKWLIYYCIDNNLELPKTILIHSMNVVGAGNIAALFNEYEKYYDR